MKAVVQRVKGASVSVKSRQISKIGPGLLVLLGIAEGDTEEQVRKLTKKIANLRIFPDEDASPDPSTGSGSPRAKSRGERSRRMNLSVLDVKGGILVVPQFTLLADTSRGHRPSFVKAAKPEVAERLYKLFIKELESLGIPVKTGEFGAYMQVSLVNDGPVTIVLHS